MKKLKGQNNKVFRIEGFLNISGTYFQKWFPQPCFSYLKRLSVVCFSSYIFPRFSLFTGLSNCSWSSCREGCTRDIFSCHHILVEYTYLQEDYKQMNRERKLEGLDPSPTKHNAVLFVNVKGCGYPPSVNCSRWITQYGVQDSTFPCYYARTNQSVAITHLDTKRDLRDLLLSTFIPLIACLVSGVALCLMHTKCITICRSPTIYDIVDG